MRIRDIEEKIEAKLTFDRAKLKRHTAVKWAPRRSQYEAMMLYGFTNDEEAAGRLKKDEAAARRADIMDSVQATTIEVGQPWPLRRGMTVVAIFSDDDVHRVYAVQTLVDLNGGSEIAPTLYTCKRGAFDYDAAGMHIDTFVDELCDEWTRIAEGMSSAESERFDVVQYLKNLPDDYSVHMAGDDILADRHHDGEDEEEGPSEPEAPSVPPAPPPVPPPPPVVEPTTP